ncbi:kinesin-like protein [Plakobranchus ocellatus]|uniref:Kinesin-like protein n=1 Tax=Plakobranchus ocellatus TaxID=259542 RepID=A0AAV4A602_9GAST|nr:kinesin-like protein [Plakobranchus ocellatus]
MNCLENLTLQSFWSGGNSNIESKLYYTLIDHCQYVVNAASSHIRAGWLKPQRTSKEAQAEDNKDEKIEQLTKKLKNLQTQLESEKKMRREAEKQLTELEEKYSKISAEATSAQRQMEAMQQSRPKTAHSRPKTPVAVPVPEGPTQQDLEQLNRKVKSLRKSQVHLKMDMLRNIGSVGAVIKEAIKAAADLKKSDIGSQQELEEIRALYQKEALQRRLLYNQLQELRGNIRVFCRPRRDDRAKMCLKFPSDQDVMVTNQEGSKKTFNFDKVYTPEVTQEQIFTDTQPIITSCVDGYNVCLLAYGQTGSGKTYTMMGPEDNPGINIRESQLHIPYRNSKLTQILRPCLGGDAKACLFVNISPDINNCPETNNTLEFGSNARQVALGQAKQNITKRPGGFPPR